MMLEIEGSIKGRFVFGKRWSDLHFLISHDILRNEYWIYNTEKEGIECIDNRRCVFFKFVNLPDLNEENLVEWRTIDLLNNIEQYSSIFSYKRTVNDLIRSIKNNKLNLDLLLSLSDKYGTLFSIKIIQDVKFRLTNII